MACWPDYSIVRLQQIGKGRLLEASQFLVPLNVDFVAAVVVAIAFD